MEPSRALAAIAVSLLVAAAVLHFRPMGLRSAQGAPRLAAAASAAPLACLVVCPLVGLAVGGAGLWCSRRAPGARAGA